MLASFQPSIYVHNHRYLFILSPFPQTHINCLLTPTMQNCVSQLPVNNDDSIDVRCSQSILLVDKTFLGMQNVQYGEYWSSGFFL